VALVFRRLLKRLLSPFGFAKARTRTQRREQARTEQEANAAARRTLSSEKQRRRARKEAIQATKAAARRAGRTFEVVSFPKSGRTWLRVMLDGLKLDATYTHDGSGHSRTSHVEELQPASDAFAGKTVVFLYRDPRDTVVSGYFQTAKRLGGYDGTISDFIRDPRHGIEKIGRFNMEWFARGVDRGRFHAVTYEDLKADTAGALTAIVAFVGAKRDAAEIATAVAEGAFETMQARERAGELAQRYSRLPTSAKPDDPQSYKVREGIVGGFRKHLGAEDIAFCNEVLARLGYPLDRHGAREA
jgi:hypothetical protein